VSSDDPDANLFGQRLRLGAVALLAIASIGALGWRTHEADPRRSWTDGPHPVINEIVSSSAGTLEDADGDTPDWIELHNPSGDPIDLTGWYLSDDDDEPARWAFPRVVLAPGEHLVVFASGNHQVDAAGNLHTDFRIARGEEPVLLVAPDGQTVVDRFPPVDTPRDTSFGRDPQDPRRRCFFAFPTPGEANAPECFDDRALGAPTFSTTSGFHDEPFDLEIVAADPDATMIYTVDGSYPDLDGNAEHTFVYDGPIRIEDRTGPPTLATIDTMVTDPAMDYWASRFTPDLEEHVLEQGTVVRARSVYGAASAAVFFVGEDRVRPDLPVISLAMDPAYLFDHETGIYVPGRTFEDYRNSDAFDPDARWNIPTNYNQRGREWERPHTSDLRRAVVFEYCRPGGECVHQQSVGVRVHGQFSRVFPQKSLRLYARNDYGDRRFHAPLFGDDGPVGHRRLLLRNGGNNNQRMIFRDAFLQSLMTHFHADTQAYEPAVLFVNGEYWGIHNLRERYDQHYLEVVHGADPDAVEILDNTSGPLQGNTADAEDAWQELLAELAEHDPGSDRFVEHVEHAIDVDNLFDYLAGHIFVGNGDWVSNNVRMWREPGGPDQPGYGPRDGRWRWLISDFDQQGGAVGRNDVEFDLFTDRLAASDDPGDRDGFPFLFARMMADDGLRERFVTRFADHLNTSFLAERTVERLDELTARLADELVRHVDRWQYRPMDERAEDVERLAEFLRERPDAQRRHLADRFDLDGTARLRVVHDETAGTVTVNTLTLERDTPGVTEPGDWEGTYFQDVPVTVTAIPADGYRFVRWDGLPPTQAADPAVEVMLDDALTLEPVFERD
jgi:hypothetical protein